jgi:hypothetical protein
MSTAPTTYFLVDVLPLILDSDDPVAQAEGVVLALRDEDLNEADRSTLCILAASLVPDLLDIIEDLEQERLEVLCPPGDGRLETATTDRYPWEDVRLPVPS